MRKLSLTETFAAPERYESSIRRKPTFMTDSEYTHRSTRRRSRRRRGCYRQALRASPAGDFDYQLADDRFGELILYINGDHERPSASDDVVTVLLAKITIDVEDG